MSLQFLLGLLLLSMLGCRSQTPVVCYDAMGINKEAGYAVRWDACRGRFDLIPLPRLPENNGVIEQ
jgi:hypothetical protein